MDNISMFDLARSEGMSAVTAARWVAYYRMKTARGEQPISLAEAVRQVRSVR